jgi:hypothetical protein
MIVIKYGSDSDSGMVFFVSIFVLCSSSPIFLGLVKNIVWFDPLPVEFVQVLSNIQALTYLQHISSKIHNSLFFSSNP